MASRCCFYDCLFTAFRLLYGQFNVFLDIVMPIYEYKCNNCKAVFELLRSIRDVSAPLCSVCNSDKVSKLISMSQFQLKGQGWASDMYDKSASKDTTSTE